MKWQQPREADGVGVAGGVAEEAVEVVVSQTRHRPKPDSPGREPSTLTFLQVTGQGVTCISGGEKELFSAQSRLLARGRMCTPRSLQSNEKLTNSAKLMTIWK